MDRKYAIDSNMLISSSRNFYSFEIAPSFWRQLIEKGHNKIIIVDKMATNSTVGRDYILKSKVENSLAIGSKEFMLKKPAELLKIARNNSLIYIYHDSIDALGDDASSEVYAFDGAEKAIEEISKIVTMIERARLVSNIYITSDHGFIYQREPL